jgi:hypothetical protein
MEFSNNEAKLSDNYECPKWLFNLLNNKFKFSADMACDSYNCKIKGSPLFDKGQNSLELDWSKWEGFKYVYPPFSKPYFQRFLKKAYDEYKKGGQIVMIVPLKTLSLDYYREIRAPLTYIVYPRVNFIFNGRKNLKPESIAILVYDPQLICNDIKFWDMMNVARKGKNEHN